MYKSMGLIIIYINSTSVNTSHLLIWNFMKHFFFYQFNWLCWNHVWEVEKLHWKRKQQDLLSNQGQRVNHSTLRRYLKRTSRFLSYQTRKHKKFMWLNMNIFNVTYLFTYESNFKTVIYQINRLLITINPTAANRD